MQLSYYPPITQSHSGSTPNHSPLSLHYSNPFNHPFPPLIPAIHFSLFPKHTLPITIQFPSTARMTEQETAPSNMKWVQPAYVLGENGEHLNETPIKVTNSLTRTKVGLLFTSFPQVPFITMIPRKVLWYSCGPTVYDVAHMGHAR